MPAIASSTYQVAAADVYPAGAHLHSSEEIITPQLPNPPAALFVDGSAQPADTLLTHAAPGAFVVSETALPVVAPLRETGGQFVLGQNFPNPHEGETTIPFTLTNPADVRLDLFDPLGRKVAGVVRRGLDAGPHRIPLNLRGLGLPAGDYSYQLQVANRYGTYRQRMPMTAAR